MTTHREFCVEIFDEAIAASHEAVAGQTDNEKQRKTVLKLSTAWSLQNSKYLMPVQAYIIK